MSPRRDFLVVRAGAARAARLAVRARYCMLLGLLLGAGQCARCVAARGQLLDAGEIVEQAQRPICVAGLVGALQIAWFVARGLYRAVGCWGCVGRARERGMESVRRVVGARVEGHPLVQV